MAVDKLVDSTQLNSDLTSVANAIRTKGGTSAQLAFPSGFVSAIGDISGDSGGNANVSQDANGYLVVDDAAPSGGGGNTNVLLASFVAEQNVSTIQISGDFSGYNLYLLELVGSANATEWIYPEFNGVANTSYYYAPRSGATNWNTVIPLIYGTYGIPQLIEDNHLSCPIFGPAGATTYTFNIGGELSSVALHLYRAQDVFVAGFKVKLWGVPLSTTA